MDTTAFTMLDTTTQTKRRQIMQAMWVEPLTATDARAFADMPVSKITVANIEVLRDRKRNTPFAANERRKILRHVLETKADGKALVANVAKLVPPFKVHTTGHHTITPAEIETYLKHHGTKSKAVLALTLLMYTGFRVSDLAQIGP